MRRALVAVVALLVVLAAPVGASTAPSGSGEQLPLISAAAWSVVGPDGAVVAQHDARARRPIASITKLMTAIVTLDDARLGDVVTVSPQATRVGEQTVYLRAGQRLTVSELLHAMLVRSANDAAEALALYVGHGSQARFVAMMNAKAHALRLDDTTFVNPHGLDAPGHLSSARDVTFLVRYALRRPFIRDALRRRAVSVPEGGVFPTTDDLLGSWRPLIGGKTGHTNGAGWSETAGARENGVTVYGAVLGSPSQSARDLALKTLLAYGLRQYNRIEAIDPNRVYAKAATGYGRPGVELVASRRALRTVRRGEALVERVVSPTTVALPVVRGQQLGRVEIYGRGHLLAASPLVAARSVSKPGLLGKVAWYARRTVHNLRELVP
jgi:D-alanyl-D-alanine carboxypeptidase (penicillin-binding protein 5/6)